LQKRGLHLTTVSRADAPEEFSGAVRQAIDDYLKHFDFQRGLIAGT